MLVYQAAHRKVYQHSVIPGGIYSAEELSRARRTDPVVAEHYLDFGEDVRVTALSRDQLVYVSYRKANKVYWTKTKHRVCKGEAVVTDGKNVARSRCGNRLSETPKSPVDKTEPSETALNSRESPRDVPGAHTGGPADTNNPGAGTGYQPDTGTGAGGPANSGATSGGGYPVQTGASPAVRTGAAKDLGFGDPITRYPSFSPVFAIGPLISPSGTGSTEGTGSTTGTPTTPPTVVVTPTPEPESVLLLMLGGLAVWVFRLKALSCLSLSRLRSKQTNS